MNTCKLFFEISRWVFVGHANKMGGISEIVRDYNSLIILCYESNRAK